MSAYIAAYIVLICFSAFFSASEMCFSSANRLRLESAAENGSKGAKVALKVMDRFDDSLSAVDTETDAQIRAALRHAQKDVTTLIISHRVTTLSQADLILVLENGQITQQGTHAELCSQPGLYQRINSIQNALEEELTQAKAAEGVN